MLTLPKRCLVVFTSYYFATKAETVLKKSPWRIQLIATPPALHHMCGLCILVDGKDLANVCRALRAAHISHSGVYAYHGPQEKSEKIHPELYDSTY